MFFLSEGLGTWAYRLVSLMAVRTRVLLPPPPSCHWLSEEVGRRIMDLRRRSIFYNIFKTRWSRSTKTIELLDQFHLQALEYELRWEQDQAARQQEKQKLKQGKIARERKMVLLKQRKVESAHRRTLELTQAQNQSSVTSSCVHVPKVPELHPYNESEM